MNGFAHFVFGLAVGNGVMWLACNTPPYHTEHTTPKAEAKADPYAFVWPPESGLDVPILSVKTSANLFVSHCVTQDSSGNLVDAGRCGPPKPEPGQIPTIDSQGFLVWVDGPKEIKPCHYEDGRPPDRACVPKEKQ